MPESFQFGGEIVWRPSPDYIEPAHLTRFMRQHDIPDFNELLRRSTEDIILVHRINPELSEYPVL